jgi:hypothetical protein
MKGDKVCININEERVVRFANKDEEYLCGLVPHLGERESALTCFQYADDTTVLEEQCAESHKK